MVGFDEGSCGVEKEDEAGRTDIWVSGRECEIPRMAGTVGCRRGMAGPAWGKSDPRGCRAAIPNSSKTNERLRIIRPFLGNLTAWPLNQAPLLIDSYVSSAPILATIFILFGIGYTIDYNSKFNSSSSGHLSKSCSQSLINSSLFVLFFYPQCT